MPAYLEKGLRVEFWGDEVERLSEFDPLTGQVEQEFEQFSLYPATQFVTPRDKVENAIQAIRSELEERVGWFEKNGLLLEAQRISMRTNYDLEMLQEVGFCSGIENYSRHMSGRKPGERPFCLIDFFPKDFLVIVDESHVSVPQIGAMYKGDRSRKTTLVEYGFRLPSALDNRPLEFEEWEAIVPSVIFTSATPGDYELRRSEGVVVEQLIRPTGLLDPGVEIRPVSGQVDDLLEEIRIRTARSERILVTTLTKRMAEDLSEYLAARGVRVRYLHSDIHTIERVEILRELRLGVFDVLVGINLLREGLDLPEVSLVAILDADKEGFLRSETSLIQTIGRAARNAEGKAVMYADRITGSMERAISETDRRREVQAEYNAEHDIVPRTIVKSVEQIRFTTSVADARVAESPAPGDRYGGVDPAELAHQLENEMKQAAQALDFERAARLRDELFEVRAAMETGSRKSNWRRSR